MAARDLRLHVKIPLIVVFIVMSFLMIGESPPTVMADETCHFHCSFWEGYVYYYEITEFETASGKIEAPVALGGGSQIFENSRPWSLGGHFLPITQTSNPRWSNLGDWRNVIMLGKGYTLEVQIDTIPPEEEYTYPNRPFIPPLVTTYNHYGAGPKTNYLPVNPYSETTVFIPARLTTRIRNREGEYVTVSATDPMTGKPANYKAFLDYKLTEPLILPIKQYGNATFYEVGDAAGAKSSWIGVGLYGGLGYWTLSYRTNTATETPLGVTPSYEVGIVGHNISTGIAQSFEIVNKAMLAWMTDPQDPLVTFRIERRDQELYCPKTSLETTTGTGTEREENTDLILATILLLLVIGGLLLYWSKKLQ